MSLHFVRTTFASAILAASLLSSVHAQANPPAEPTQDSNMLIYAAAWKQTAAEYRALYHQAFNMARMQLDLALQKPSIKPLAIITDIDDTILNASNYWGYLIGQNKDFFDDEIWDAWVPTNNFVATPGSLEFLNYADSKGVQIFYVSNRNQGEGTYEYAIGNLKAVGFPQVDEEHVTILIDTSNKEVPQQEIAQNYNVVVMLGDNLNDFQRRYYVKDVDERIRLMEEDKHMFGRQFILLPNPTDGQWIRAIFGDSEPPESAENRAIFKKAAMRSQWNGQK